MDGLRGDMIKLLLIEEHAAYLVRLIEADKRVGLPEAEEKFLDFFLKLCDFRLSGTVAIAGKG